MGALAPISPKVPAVNNAQLDAASNVSANTTSTTTAQQLQAAPLPTATNKPAAPGPMGVAGGLSSGKI